MIIRRLKPNRNVDANDVSEKTNKSINGITISAFCEPSAFEKLERVAYQFNNVNFVVLICLWILQTTSFPKVILCFVGSALNATPICDKIKRA